MKKLYFILALCLLFFTSNKVSASFNYLSGYPGPQSVRVEGYSVMPIEFEQGNSLYMHVDFFAPFQINHMVLQCTISAWGMTIPYPYCICNLINSSLPMEKGWFGTIDIELIPYRIQLPSYTPFDINFGFIERDSQREIVGFSLNCMLL